LLFRPFRFSPLSKKNIYLGSQEINSPSERL
jgi:hypothetical protein